MLPNFTAEVRPQMLAGMRRSPLWQMALRNARSIPAEVDSYSDYRLDESVFQDFTTPTIILLGSTSGPVVRQWMEELFHLIPTSQIVILEGQGHGAMIMAPEWFSQTVSKIIGTPEYGT